MIFKKLPKELADEGITLDLLNHINMENNFSPAILQVGDEPAKLIKCSAGYWVVLEDGSILKGKVGYHVVPEKECQIGRGRYLLTFGKSERKEKVESLIDEWKNAVIAKMEKIKSDIDHDKRYLAGEFSLSGALMEIAWKENGGKPSEEMLKKKVDAAAEKYEELALMLAEDKYVDLLQILGIKSFYNPMLSVKIDDEKGMATLKNVFSAGALKEWTDDRLYPYAALEIDKQYPYLVF